MRLLAAHQILIGSAIVLAVLFAIRSAFLFGRAAAPADLVLALLSVAVAAVLGLYLRKLRANARKAERRRPPGG